MAKYVILIAGNICAGKSEFVRYVKKNKDQFSSTLRDGEEVIDVPEFIDQVALQLFYQNREKYTPIFENSCLISRQVRTLKAKHTEDLYLFDRGMIEGAHTFCLNSFKEGYLSHKAFNEYIESLKNGFDTLGRTEQHSWLERVVVYLQVKNADVLDERQKRRDTKGELIPRGYLERINELYERFFENIDRVYSSYELRTPAVLCVDAETDFRKDPEYHQRILTKMLQVVEGDLHVPTR